MVSPIELYIVLSALAFSAFFSGIEIAFISADKLQIEVQANNGHFLSKLLSGFVHNPARFLATTLIGNNIALVVYGIFMARLLLPFLEQWPFLLDNQVFVKWCNGLRNIMHAALNLLSKKRSRWGRLW